MNVHDFLSRLEKVRKTGHANWTACCPAHQDRSPSLSVAEAADGRILLRCFSECSAEEVVNAVGLTLADLFPERIALHGGKPMRRPFPAADVLETLSRESLFVYTIASDMTKGKTPSEKDRERLLLAVSRIGAAREAANG